MTSVYKEYEVKIKMAAAKSEVFIGFTIKIVICWGNKPLVVGKFS